MLGQVDLKLCYIHVYLSLLYVCANILKQMKRPCEQTCTIFHLKSLNLKFFRGVGHHTIMRIAHAITLLLPYTCPITPLSKRLPTPLMSIKDPPRNLNILDHMFLSISTLLTLPHLTNSTFSLPLVSSNSVTLINFPEYETHYHLLTYLNLSNQLNLK